MENNPEFEGRQAQEPTKPKRNSARLWWLWVGCVLLFAIIVGGGWKWRLMWCTHHNYCRPTEIRIGRIRTVGHPTPDEPNAIGFISKSVGDGGEYHTPTGPSSFAVSNGVLAVADTVKQRVALFDADTLQFKTSIDEFNFPPQRVNLSGDTLLVRAGFGLSDNDAICSIGSRQCAVLADATLPEVKRLRAQEEALARLPDVPPGVGDAPNLVSKSLVGQDRRGNIYILVQQVSEDRNTRVSTIRKYSSGRVLVATSPPLPVGNRFDALDRLRVDEDGTCYVLLMFENDLQIWRWVTHDEK